MRVALSINGLIEASQVAIVRAFIETIASAVDELLIFDHLSGNKLRNIVKHVDNLTFVKLDISEFDEWNAVLKYYKSVIIEFKVDVFIFYKMMLSSLFNHENTNIVKRLNECTSTGEAYRTGMNYSIAKSIMQRFLLIKAAASKCKMVYHYVLDPQEAKLEKLLEFKQFKRLYFMKREGFKFIPALEPSLFWLCQDLVEGYRENEFVFYCSAVTDDRKYISKRKEQLEAVANWDVRINIAGRGSKPLNQIEYYKKLANSRFTLCIPAYNKTAFSMLRFHEAIFCGCLPLVEHKCILDDVRNTFPAVCDIIERELIVKGFKGVANVIETMDEQKRLNILQKILKTPGYIVLTDLKLVSNAWKKLIYEVER